MLKLRKKSDPCAGTVLFRGSPAPRPEHMSYLRQAGVAIGATRQGKAGWQVRIEAAEGAYPVAHERRQPPRR